MDCSLRVFCFSWLVRLHPRGRSLTCFLHRRFPNRRLFHILRLGKKAQTVIRACMTKFRALIQQLSEQDYESIRFSLIENKAGKSVTLLETVREHNLPDARIMERLKVKASAYYTLRSRLNQRVEEFLMQQLENPRTILQRKVLNVSEILFTKTRDVAIATLKKLEKELKDYDLSSELSLVYKALKKLHINHSNYFQYSQLYNRQVAYMLAMDKAEDLLSEYFKKYGYFFLSANPQFKEELTLLRRELDNVCALYQSHRLFIYNSCVDVFHRIFVDPEGLDDDQSRELTPTEDLLAQCEKILASYKLDPVYFHLTTVFEFLRFCYYNHFRLYRKMEEGFGDINMSSPQLLTNFNLYTFPAAYLFLKLKRALRRDDTDGLHGESISLYEDIKFDSNDIAQTYVFTVYQSLAAYYSGVYDKPIRWMTRLINDLTYKQIPVALVEARIFLIMLHFLQGNKDVAPLIDKSVTRQIRTLPEDIALMPSLFNKMLRLIIKDDDVSRRDRAEGMGREIEVLQPKHFSPLAFIPLDTQFFERLYAKHEIEQ